MLSGLSLRLNFNLRLLIRNLVYYPRKLQVCQTQFSHWNQTAILPGLILQGYPLSTAVLMADARYCIEYAKTGRSSCKKCKQQIEKGVGRIGKITANPFSDDGGDMKVWYHTRCMFETLKVQWYTRTEYVCHYDGVT